MISMKIEEIRREFFKLKIKGHSYSQCRIILKAKFNHSVHTRTLKRWNQRLNTDQWDLCDMSRRPKSIRRRINDELRKDIISLRNETGWGERKLCLSFDLSHTSINKVLRENSLCRQTKSSGKRIKYVRWQRKNPNSLWQIDHTDEQELFDSYTLSILDDCSRYSIALVPLKQVTTNVVIKILDDMIKAHGKPRQILTDNGGAYGLKSKHSRFDRWCKKRNIEHIRTKVHSPTTNGKVERLFKTMDNELAFCNNDLELFRMRYNHSRPHCSLAGKTPADIYFA